MSRLKKLNVAVIASILVACGLTLAFIGIFNGGLTLLRNMNIPRILDINIGPDMKQFEMTVGVVEPFTTELEPYSELKIDSDFSTVELRPSADAKFRLTYDGKKDFLHYKLTGKMLEVSEVTDETHIRPFYHRRRKGSMLILEIPQGYLDKIDLHVDLGKLMINNIKTNCLIASASMGEITFKNLEVNDSMDMNVNLGKISGSMVRAADKVYDIKSNADLGKIYVDKAFINATTENTGSAAAAVDSSKGEGKVEDMFSSKGKMVRIKLSANLGSINVEAVYKKPEQPN